MVEDGFKEGVNKLLNIKGQSSAFDYDSYDWGCLRYMLELWIFLNRLSKQGIRTIRDFLKIEEALDFLSSNKSCMKLMGSLESIRRYAAPPPNGLDSISCSTSSTDWDL